MSELEFHEVTWYDGKKEALTPPDPAFPKGRHIDASQGMVRVCRIPLPYPAKRCGLYVIVCSACELNVAVQTCGRADDPRSVTLGCHMQHLDHDHHFHA